MIVSSISSSIYKCNENVVFDFLLMDDLLGQSKYNKQTHTHNIID